MLAMKNDISRIRQSSESGIVSHNMMIAESSAIKRLTQDNTLTIEPADKGGTIVVMDSLQYTQEIQRQLNNCNVYDITEIDPKFKLGRMIHQTVEEAVMRILLMLT